MDLLFELNELRKLKVLKVTKKYGDTAFRSRSCNERSSKKTSASSMTTMAFQIAVILKTFINSLSTELAVAPRSPALTTYKGRCRPVDEDKVL